MALSKKEISKYVHKLINQGNLEEAESFLRECLDAGERDTIILGSLINVYKAQSGRWKEIEGLAIEYLALKPNNSFAKNSLELAKKMREKSKRIAKESIIEPAEEKATEFPEDKVRDFRRKIYDGDISVENISDKQLKDFTEFERTMLLAELYSHSNMTNTAIRLLKQASSLESTTPREKKIIAQAIQLANSTKMAVMKRKIQWEHLSSDKEREK